MERIEEEARSVLAGGAASAVDAAPVAQAVDEVAAGSVAHVGVGEGHDAEPEVAETVTGLGEVVAAATGSMMRHFVYTRLLTDEEMEAEKENEPPADESQLSGVEEEECEDRSVQEDDLPTGDFPSKGHRNLLSRIVGDVHDVLDQKYGVEYFVMAPEVAPTTGRPHMQGCFSLKKKARLTAVRKLCPGFDVRVMRAATVQEAARYCIGPWENKDGTKKKPENPYAVELGAPNDNESAY